MLAQIARERAGGLRVVALDADANPGSHGPGHGVLSMPTLDLYVGGRLVARTVGARAKTALDAVLDEQLAACGQLR